MSALPALTRAYWARANIPIGAFNTTQLELEGFWAWMLHACLLDLATTGTTSTSLGGAARPANSIWICRGSSDGVGGGGAVSAVGVAGTNRWWNGGVFPGMVRGSNGANHHWILLENVTLGYELLINMSQNAGYITVDIAKTGTWSGGNATTTPTPTLSGARVIGLGQTGWNATDGGQLNIFADTTNFGLANRFHFCVAPNGEFWYGASRVGLGVLYNFMMVWRTTGQQVGDDYNTFLICAESNATGRASITASRMAQPACCAGLTPSTAQRSGGGIIVWYNNVSFSGTTVDTLSAEYLSHALQVIDFSPGVTRRGLLPDLQLMGGGPIGSSIPNSSAQERTLAGDMVLPLPLVNLAL